MSDNYPTRYIPIHPALTSILSEIIQTRDVFHIRFNPRYSECEISITEFRNYLDIRREILQRLMEYKFPHGPIHLFLLNIDNQSEEIDNNIEYFGVTRY